jgi:hypothetical protein
MAQVATIKSAMQIPDILGHLFDLGTAVNHPNEPDDAYDLQAGDNIEWIRHSRYLWIFS